MHVLTYYVFSYLSISIIFCCARTGRRGVTIIRFTIERTVSLVLKVRNKSIAKTSPGSSIGNRVMKEHRRREWAVAKRMAMNTGTYAYSAIRVYCTTDIILCIVTLQKPPLHQCCQLHSPKM